MTERVPISVYTDALARIANTYATTSGDDPLRDVREFAWAALRCESTEEYEALLAEPS